jgi:hypothetical protein
MAGFLRELKELLTASGCYFVIDHGVKSRHTANETLKQAGLPKAF